MIGHGYDHYNEHEYDYCIDYEYESDYDYGVDYVSDNEYVRAMTVMNMSMTTNIDVNVTDMFIMSTLVVNSMSMPSIMHMLLLVVRMITLRRMNCVVVMMLQIITIPMAIMLITIMNIMGIVRSMVTSIGVRCRRLRSFVFWFTRNKKTKNMMFGRAMPAGPIDVRIRGLKPRFVNCCCCC